jgi:hypothetical protein
MMSGVSHMRAINPRMESLPYFQLECMRKRQILNTSSWNFRMPRIKCCFQRGKYRSFTPEKTRWFTSNSICRKSVRQFPQNTQEKLFFL